MAEYSDDIEDLIIEQQPLLTGAMAKYRHTNALEKKFSAMSRFDEPYIMYKTTEASSGDYIYVPRAVCPVGVKDTRTKGFKTGFVSKIKARDAEQQRIFDDTYAFLAEGLSGTLRAGTGRGKTVAGLEVMCRLQRSTLVVVPKEDLMDQWYNRIIDFVGIPKNRIGFVQGDVCDYQAKWVVLSMVHSIAKEGRYPKDLYQMFGLTIFDEVHRMAADTFSQALEILPSYLRLGLSATPERADGKELLVEAHIGPVRVISDAAPMSFKVLIYRSSWECPRRMVDGELRRMEHSAGKCGHVINMLAGHKPTNLKIAEFIGKSYRKERFMIVFSDRVEHLQDLMGLAKAAGVPQKDMDFYIGTMSKSEKNKAVGKRVLFATYGMMKEGTDLPWFDTLIFATPRSDVKQAVGRILREYENKKPPVVFDVVHEDSPVFHGYSKKRRAYYDEAKAVVKNVH